MTLLQSLKDGLQVALVVDLVLLGPLGTEGVFRFTFRCRVCELREEKPTWLLLPRGYHLGGLTPFLLFGRKLEQLLLWLLNSLLFAARIGTFTRWRARTTARSRAADTLFHSCVL